MATAQLKRHQAVLWLPPRSNGERAFGSEAILIAQTASGNGTALRRASLDSLSGIRQVWLIADARDVTVLDVVVPPLSGARLRQALPNVVEEYLLQDASRCLIVPGPKTSEGRRLVAVIDRDWFDFVVGALQRRQIRIEAFWPEQQVLPLAQDQWTVACKHGGITLRAGDTGPALGWNVGDDPSQREHAVLDLLAASGIGEQPPERIAAYVDDVQWKEPLAAVSRKLRIGIEMRPLPLVRSGPIDLMLGRETGLKATLAQIDWNLWRLPVVLAGLLLLTFLVGLNLHWMRDAAERRQLAEAVLQRYRATFPNAPPPIDPALQMKRGVAEMRARAGRAAPDDLVPMIARLGQALDAQSRDAISAMEYREGRLKVRFTPQVSSGEAARERLRQACTRLGLRLQFDNERDPTATIAVVGG